MSSAPIDDRARSFPHTRAQAKRNNCFHCKEQQLAVQYLFLLQHTHIHTHSMHICHSIVYTMRRYVTQWVGATIGGKQVSNNKHAHWARSATNAFQGWFHIIYCNCLWLTRSCCTTQNIAHSLAHSHSLALLPYLFGVQYQQVVRQWPLTACLLLLSHCKLGLLSSENLKKACWCSDWPFQNQFQAGNRTSHTFGVESFQQVAHESTATLSVA